MCKCSDEFAYYPVKLMAIRFLDIALVCEYKDDTKMAALTAAKAVQVKQDSQGVDFAEYAKYAAVLQRIEGKLQKA
jgi:tRNA U34 2-thiouridine synthase MnmA/TrmU